MERSWINGIIFVRKDMRRCGMGASRKWMCGLLLFCLGATFSVVLWGEATVDPAEALTGTAYFGHPAVSIIAGIHGDTANLQIRFKQLDLERERPILIAYRDELGLSVDQIKSMTYYAGVQVMQQISSSAASGKVEWKEVTDFRNLPDLRRGYLKGAPSALILAFQFKEESKVPKLLYFIVDNSRETAKKVTMATTGSKVSENGFDMVLERTRDGDTIVLIVTVFQWPEGDPKCGGG